MSLDKAIKYKKEHRKQYYGSKAIDKTCRCHGGCEYCLENKTYKYKKKELTTDWEKQKMVYIEENDIDYYDANVKDVTLNGEALDGHYFNRMIKEIDF